MIIYLNDKNNVRKASLEFDKTTEIKVTTYGYNGEIETGAYILKIKRQYKKSLKECKNFEEFEKIENLHGVVLYVYKNYGQFIPEY